MKHRPLHALSADARGFRPVRVSQVLVDVAGRTVARRLACDWFQTAQGQDTGLCAVVGPDGDPIELGGFTLEALRFHAHRLDAALRIGETRLLSIGEYVVVTVRTVLPATVTVAARGRALRQVVLLPLTLDAERNTIEHSCWNGEREEVTFRVFAGMATVLVRQ